MTTRIAHMPAFVSKLASKPTHIKRYYTLALALLAVAVLTNFTFMEISLQIQDAKVRLSALASEQSRLFIDIGSLTRHLMDATTTGNVSDDSLDSLRHRILDKAARARANTAEILALDTTGIAGLFSAGTVSKYYTQAPHELQMRLNQVIRRSEEIARLDTSRLRGRLQYSSSIDIVLASGTLMQEGFDAAMAESYRVSQQNVHLLRRIEVMITLIALALIVLEARYIFAPLVRRLQAEHAQTQQYERELFVQARQDALTGLDNRLAFREALDRFIRIARDDGPSFGLVLFDLDRFKPINDMLGHPAGDHVLVTIGERLSHAAGSEAVVARLGGDEFGILSQQLSDETIAPLFIDRLRQAVEVPTRYAGHDLHPVGSFGAALYSNPADGAEDLFGAADVALYAAKAGPDAVQIYDAGMRAEAETSRQLAIDLRKGLASGELTAFYQPQVRLADGLLIGFEALVRWWHPTLGLLAPGRFLPVVERHGLMTELTAFMIERVCTDVARWLAAGLAPGTVFVNIPETMLATEMAQTVFAAALDRHGLSYDRLGIEVTENALLDRNTRQICANLDALRERGMRVSFDDFGTGYASLSHLKSFPFDELKVDRSFIKDLPGDVMSVEIVRTLIALARNAGKTIIAEGIETDVQRDFLEAEACELGQGYLFSPPVAFEDATVLIKAGRFPRAACLQTAMYGTDLHVRRSSAA